MSERHAALTSLPPILPRLIRRFAVVIVLLWLGFTAFVNLAVPQLEVVGKAHSVSMSPSDAASIQAIKRVGQVFGEFDSDNAVTIVLEGDQPQAVRSQAADEHSAVAPGGNGNCALAGAGARGDMLGRLHWLAGLAQLPDNV